MTFKEIQELVGLINKSNISEFKLKDGEFALVVRTSKYVKGKTIVTSAAPAPAVVAAPIAAPVAAPAPAPAAAAPAAAPAAPAPAAASDDSKYVAIKSPIVGTFYKSAGPGKPNFVQVGDTVEPGKVVCIIEAMKLFNEIESDIKGKIVKIMIEDATPVEYDQVLFLVDPS